MTFPDPEFSFPGDQFCTFNTTLTPLHASGLDGAYNYAVINGGPNLDLDSSTGVIQTGNSDPGEYEVTNTVQGCGRMLITGVMDGTLTGGLPKAIELYALADINNLSQYGLGSANNGGGSDGIELAFPPMNVAAGTYLHIATEEIVYDDFFLDLPDFISNASNINGNDAIELFCGGTVIDVFGDPNMDGSGQPWDYTDGWAYRNNNTTPNFGNFNLANWTFSGPNALDGESDNSSAAIPFPIHSFTSMGFIPPCPDTSFTDTIELLYVSSSLNACQDKVFLSLDGNCQLEVTSGMLMTGENHICFDLFPVRIVDHYGNELGTMLSEKHRGKELTYSVSDGENSCWGTLVVEDKLAPEVACLDTAVSCLEPYKDDYLYVDNCGFEPEVQVVHNRWNDLGCGDTIGYYNRRIVVTDIWGNSADCEQNIYVTREVLDSLECPELIIIDCCDPRLNSFLTNTFDDKGRAHPIPYYISGVNIGIVDAPLINGHPIAELGDKCNINTSFKDIVLEDCGGAYKIRREWKIYDWCESQDTTCVQYVKIVDTTGPEVEPVNPITAYVNSHECKAHVELDFPWINKDCSDEENLKTFFQITYYDERDNTSVITGEIPFGGFETVYLPLGDYEVEYRVVDECWNETYVYQEIWVIDNIPPTPVCDEITQVTLDPTKCWVRIYAEDLDDGSNDNCCEELHFAVATMSDLDRVTDSLHLQFKDCYGDYDYNHYSKYIEQFIQYYINCFVFDDYVDLEECGLDSLVLRVFESCELPLYDPHTFKGSKHDWYCFNLYDDFACRYLIHYDELDEYLGVPGELTCNEGRYDHASLGFNCAFPSRNNYEEVNRLDYRYIIESPNLIGSGTDTAFTLILDRPAYIYGIPYKMLRVSSNGYISTDLSDEGDDSSNDCDLPKVPSSGGGDRLYVLHSDFGADIGYEYFHRSPYPHPNGAVMGAHVISWFTFSAYEFQVLLFDNGDIIYQYKGFHGLEEYTIGAQTFKGDHYTNVGCDESLTFSPIAAVGMSPWGFDLSMSPGCIQPYQAEPNDLWCDFQVDTAHPYYEKWLQVIAEYPELEKLIKHRKRFPHLYNDCMIVVIKDDKTPPVCVAPKDVSYYCDGVPVVGSLFPNGGNDEIKWTSAKFAHDMCFESDGWDPNCEFDRVDDLANSYNMPYDACVAAPWDGGDHGYYAGPSHSDYSYDEPCYEDLSAWYPDEHYTWKPIYCRFWLMLDKYDAIEGDGKPDPTTYFGEPEYYDNCWYPDIDSTTEGSLDECGVGKLTRTWTVTDKCGNTSSCYQTVTIKPRSDFEVKFPADIVVNCDDSVSLDPDKTNPDLYPQIKDDDCELIGITYSDQVIDIFEDGCYKILRTWKVIDWCVFVPDIHSRYPDVIVDDRIVADPDERPCVYRCLKDDGDGFMTYLQVIKIVDEVAPEVVCSSDSVFCIYDENCEDLYVEYDLGSATDNCTEGLRYRYTINPNGDSEESDWIFGHGTILQNTLPVGEHLVTLYAADDCGNEGYCQLTVTVRDCKPPTPYCYNGIATVVMPSTNEVTVWAIDLDAGSFDNCTEQENLRFTFSDVHPDEDDTYSEEDRSSSMVFTCDQLGQVEVTVYVWDESDNVDFCVTYLLIQPGDAACGTRILNQDNSRAFNLREIHSEFQNPSNSNPEYKGLYLSGFKPNIILKQNRPNPFRETTIIEFILPETMKANIRVMDVTGKLIYTKESVYSKGLNQVWISEDDLGIGPGIMYFQLRVNNYISSIKLVLIH